MANVMENIVTQLLNVGFYDFLLFLFSITVFFAVLKKSKILGESPLINGVIAFVAAFLIFSFPMITGLSLTFQLSNAFMHLMMWMFIFIIAGIIASFFYPDLPKMLGEQFTQRTFLYIGIILGLVIGILSGLIPQIISGLTGPRAPVGPQIPLDIINMATGVIIFLVIIVIAAATVTKKD